MANGNNQFDPDLFIASLNKKPKAAASQGFDPDLFIASLPAKQQADPSMGGMEPEQEVMAPSGEDQGVLGENAMQAAKMVEASPLLRSFAEKATLGFSEKVPAAISSLMLPFMAQNPAALQVKPEQFGAEMPDISQVSDDLSPQAGFTERMKKYGKFQEAFQEADPFSYENILGKQEDRLAQLRQESPVSAIIGDIAGYAAPGGAFSRLYGAAGKGLSSLGLGGGVAIPAAIGPGGIGAGAKALGQEGAGALLKTALATTGAQQIEDFDPSQIPEQLAYGAGGEVLGRGVGKLLELPAAALKGPLKKAGTRLYESVLKRPKKILEQEARRGKVLGEELLEQGVTGTKKGLMRKAKETLKSQEDRLQNVLESTDKPVDPEDIVSAMRPLKGRYNRPGIDEVRKASRIQDEIDDILTYPKDLSAKEANIIKREIYKDIPKAWDKDFNAFSEGLQKAKARGFRKAIEKAAGGRGKEVASINKQLGVMSRFKEAMEGQQALTTRKNFISPVDLLMGSLAGGGAYLGSPGDDKTTKTIMAMAGFGLGRSPLVKTKIAQLLQRIPGAIQGASRPIGPAIGLFGPGGE